MNTIWVLILVVLGSDGKLYTQLSFPQKPEYNTEKSCKESGTIIANKAQLEIGTTNGKVFFYCEGVSRTEITKSLLGA